MKKAVVALILCVAVIMASGIALADTPVPVPEVTPLPETSFDFSDMTQSELQALIEQAQAELKKLEAPQPNAEDAQAVFDGSSLDEKGDGEFHISTAGGTSEDGNVPVIYYESNVYLKQLGFSVRSFDGTKLTYLYVDGDLIDERQLQNTDSSLTLSSQYFEIGTHTVEAVQYSENDPSKEIMGLKRAQYEVREK